MRVATTSEGLPAFRLRTERAGCLSEGESRLGTDQTLQIPDGCPGLLCKKERRGTPFTKLDVRWGFNNIRIKEGDKWKAAFRTNRGLFEPLVMFFSLTNSPATFQTMMDDIFEDLISEGIVVVYLEDILIFTETLEEHRKVTCRVLELLEKHKLYLRPDKCESKWPAPTNKKEVQSFLGFTNFYRQFIKDFSEHARPLFDLT